jgi:hypothetical protein
VSDEIANRSEFDKVRDGQRREPYPNSEMWERFYQRFPNIRASLQVSLSDARVYQAARDLVEQLELIYSAGFGNEALHPLVTELSEALREHDAIPSAWATDKGLRP